MASTAQPFSSRLVFATSSSRRRTRSIALRRESDSTKPAAPTGKSRMRALFAEQSASSTKRLDVTFLLCVCRDEPHWGQPEEDRLRRRAYNARAKRKHVEGAGGTNAPPAGPSGMCAAPAARPGTSRDSVQAVVLPGRHWRPVIAPTTQLGGPVACPSLTSMTHLPR